MMKKIIFLAILIAALAAFFASSHPDGLQKTLGLAAGHENPTTAAISGIIGVLLIFGLFQGIKIFFSTR